MVKRSTGWLRDASAILVLGILLVVMLTATGCTDGSVHVSGYIERGQSVTITNEGPSPSSSVLEQNLSREVR